MAPPNSGPVVIAADGSGDYTNIGAWNTALVAAGNTLLGDVDVIIRGTIVETGNVSIGPIYSGYTLSIYGEVSPATSVFDGSCINGNALWELQLTESNAAETKRWNIHDVRFDKMALSCVGAGFIAAITYASVYNIVSNGAGSNGYAIYCGNNLSHPGEYVRIYNCLIYDWRPTASAVVYMVTNEASSVTIENCTIYTDTLTLPGDTLRGIRSASYPQIARNNVVVLPAGSTCYSLQSGSTEEKNAASDETGSEGLQNIVAADEFASLTWGNVQFLDPGVRKRGLFTIGGAPRSGRVPHEVAFSVEESAVLSNSDSRLAITGTAPTYATTDLRGTTRGQDGTYGIGAYEPTYTEEYDTQVL